MLNFVPDTRAAVDEMISLAAPGGALAACVWDYAEGMEFLRIFWDAAIRVDPAAEKYDEGSRFPVCRRDGLEGLGLRRVPVEQQGHAGGFAAVDREVRARGGVPGAGLPGVAGGDGESSPHRTPAASRSAC